MHTLCGLLQKVPDRNGSALNRKAAYRISLPLSLSLMHTRRSLRACPDAT
jgi:hypothetical protein